MVRRFTSLVGSALLATALSAGSYVLQRRIGLNLADEGYIWTGARDTAAGALPLRDFDSYDPLRYWWTAGVMRLRKDKGILTMRLAAAAWEAAGLFAFLRLAKRAKLPPATTCFEALLLQVWMAPLYRSFDNAMPILGTLALTRLLERPNHRRFFETGAFASVAAMVGRNHGVYALMSVGLAGLLAPFGRREWRRACIGLPLGLALGYAPIVALFRFDRRFRSEFLRSIGLQVTRGSAPATIPVPWPWRVLGRTRSRRQITLSLLFFTLPVTYGVALLARFIAPKSAKGDPSVLAASCVGAAYLHYVYSRAGLYHLTAGIFPSFYLICRSGAVPRLAFAAATAALAEYLTPLLQMVRSSEPFRSVAAGDDTLILPNSEAEFLENLERALRTAGAGDRPIAFVPHYPALYAALSKPSVLYESYLAVSSPENRQAELIAQLERNGVDFVVARDIALDLHEGRRLQNTHALFWNYVLDRYERVPTPALPADVLLLRRSQSAVDQNAMPSRVRFDEASVRRVAGSGLFPVEQAGSMWVTPRILLKLWVPHDATSLVVEGVTPDLPTPNSPRQHVTCTIGSILVGEAAIGPGPFEATFALSRDVPRGRASVVELVFAEGYVPSEMSKSGDARTLGALLSTVAFR